MTVGAGTARALLLAAVATMIGCWHGNVNDDDPTPLLTVLVSVNSSEAQQNAYDDMFLDDPPAVSSDGRYVAFTSKATNLVSETFNPSMVQVFLRDTWLGTTELISIGLGGTGGNGDSSWPSLSADGRRVAFASKALNLVDPGTSPALQHVFVRDRLTGTTTMVSVDANGQEENAWSYRPAISADGRTVAFHSDASDLVSSDTNVATDVFVRDLNGGTTTRVSVVDVTSAQSSPNGINSLNASISSDGRYVAFQSPDTNLVPSDNNSAIDVFVRDTATSRTFIASSKDTQTGPYSLGGGTVPAISGDGRFVAFLSDSDDLGHVAFSIPFYNNDGLAHVYLRDRQDNRTYFVDITPFQLRSNGHAYAVGISADGQTVVFESAATDLISGDSTSSNRDIYKYDHARRVITLESVATGGKTQGNGTHLNPAVSRDGKTIAFESTSTNLITDFNEVRDIFKRGPG